MELTTVKELFSDREKYLDKEVQVAAGSAASVTRKHSASSY